MMTSKRCLNVRIGNRIINKDNIREAKITVARKLLQTLKMIPLPSRTGMRKLVTLALLVLFSALLPSCSRHSGPTTTVVKPKYQHRFFDRKRDKRVKRTKTVKMRN